MSAGPATPTAFHAPLAWLDGRWQAEVLMRVRADGHWTALSAGVPAPADAVRLGGPVLPTLVDAHSHAFQRAFTGLAEQRDSDSDDFWSWRDRMYGVALRVTPAQLKDIAAQLYTELLAGGYTQVCEFHYLHHREDGTPYEDEHAMALALAEAAQEVGIGLTLLPVLYAHAGFAQRGLRETQRRFRTDADWVWQACRRPMQLAPTRFHDNRCPAARKADTARPRSAPTAHARRGLPAPVRGSAARKAGSACCRRS